MSFKKYFYNENQEDGLDIELTEEDFDLIEREEDTNVPEMEINLDEDEEIVVENEKDIELSDDIYSDVLEEYAQLMEIKVKTPQEIRKKRARTQALAKATKGKWASWGIPQKARFLAKFEYRPISDKKGKFVRRETPKDIKSVVTQLKAKKKMMKVKGKMIAKKAARGRALARKIK